jgi:hypothetical protein
MNYFNILPIVVIETIIIAIFEGIFLFVYISKTEEELLTKTLSENLNFSEYIVPSLQKYKIPELTFKQSLINLLSPFIAKEKSYIDSEYTKSLLILIFIILGLVMLVIVYSFIIKKYNGHIDWFKVAIITIVTTILIASLEVLYVFLIIFKKKYNDLELKVKILKSIM